MKRIKTTGFGALACFTAWLFCLPALTEGAALVNPGFESNGGAGTSADNWSNGGASGVESWAAHSDSWGMAIYGWTGDNWGHFYQDVNVSAGENYSFSLWINKDNTFAASTVNIEMEWYSSGSGFLGETKQAVLGSLNSSWQQFSITGTAPAGTDYVRAFIDVTGITAGGAVKFDDTQLTLNENGAVPEPATAALFLLSLLATGVNRYSVPGINQFCRRS